MSEAKEFFSSIGQKMNQVKEQLPQAFGGFMGLFGNVMAEGTISVLEKELIALGIGISAKCPPCIRMHVKKCIDAGATREQILEAASVAVMMGGGPAFMHVTEVIEALDALGK
jgi:AhpD family alkylhydroperoxidase